MKMSNLLVETILTVAATSISLGIGGAKAGDLDGGVASAQMRASIFQLAMMDDAMEMKGKKGDMGSMGAMPQAGPMSGSASNDPMRDPAAAPSGADMMGRMRGAMPAAQGMGALATASRLPGFPGASHLYHVGATGFFLDHPQHITLSVQQQGALNRLKEKALLERNSFDRRIEEAEQELWSLTGADMPDAAKIDAKIRAIEKLRGDQRMAYIRTVGEAARNLTSDQVAALLGTQPPLGAAPPAKPAPMPRM